MAIHEGEFDVEILRDLINEGYEGQELLNKFIEIRDKVPVAFEMMCNDIIKESNGKSYTIEEVFGNEYA